MRQIAIESGLILLVSILFAISFHFSFILKSLKGDLVIRPDLESDQAAGAAQFRKISLAEARKRFDEKAAIFVDARASLFYQVGHIPGAISLPREEYEKRPDLTLLAAYRQKGLVLYCNGKDCPDSAVLATYLTKKGFLRVEVFEGGFPEWQEAGYPDEK
jgi:rhodanese-related sulfurtransferase